MGVALYSGWRVLFQMVLLGKVLWCCDGGDDVVIEHFIKAYCGRLQIIVHYHITPSRPVVFPKLPYRTYNN
jgi:hypothetical protein